MRLPAQDSPFSIFMFLSFVFLCPLSNIPVLPSLVFLSCSQTLRDSFSFHLSFRYHPLVRYGGRSTCKLGAGGAARCVQQGPAIFMFFLLSSFYFVAKHFEIQWHSTSWKSGRASDESSGRSTCKLGSGLDTRHCFRQLGVVCNDVHVCSFHRYMFHVSQLKVGCGSIVPWFVSRKMDDLPLGG